MERCLMPDSRSIASRGFGMCPTSKPSWSIVRTFRRWEPGRPRSSGLRPRWGTRCFMRCKSACEPCRFEMKPCDLPEMWGRSIQGGPSRREGDARTRRPRSGPARLVLSLLLLVAVVMIRADAGTLGVFEGQSDVGATRHAGAASQDAAGNSYTVTGGGANMWFTNDAFHFVWKKMSGDVTLAADISFLGTGGDPHRKACLLVRQSLQPDSAYADAVLHGDGLNSLQYRAAAGERTYEIQSGVSGPKRLRIEKRGRYVSMSIARDGGELHPAGGSFRLD